MKIAEHGFSVAIYLKEKQMSMLDAIDEQSLKPKRKRKTKEKATATTMDAKSSAKSHAKIPVRKAYLSWSEEDEEQLAKLHQKGYKIKDLSELFGRTRGSIRARLKKLGILE
jgi:hypothetical protein